MKRPDTFSAITATIGLGILLVLCFIPVHGSSIATAAYSVVENAGSALTQRGILNFTGTGVTCADNSGATRTDCTINAPGSGSFTLTNDGATGTTVNKLAKVNGSGNAVIATTSDTAIPVWVVTNAGGGTSGSATLATSGLATCTADASGVTVLHFIVASTTTNGACKDAGATAPTSGWVLGIAQTGAAANATFTLALLEGYNAASGGSGTFSAAPPYFSDGTHFFSPTAYTVTKPSGSPSWINSVTPPTVTAGANGDIVLSSTNSSAFFAQLSGTTSVEAEFRCQGTQTASETNCWIWAFDTTNSHIFSINVGSTQGGNSGGAQIDIVEWNYNGSGNPSFNSTPLGLTGSIAQDIYHFKIVKSGSSLLFQESLNGGITFVTIFTQTGIGTLADLGYGLQAATSGTNPLVIMDVLSLVVN